MQKKMILTIGRQYGSGGREIGEKIAKALEIPCYDKELLTIAAKQSGLCEELFQRHDEKANGNFLYSLVMGACSSNHLPINHKLFLEQFEAIRSIADKGSCVIIGRCADYALEGYEECIRVFVHGKLRDRVNRAIEEYGIDGEEAEEIVLKVDKDRAAYYDFYSGKKWGAVDQYDITIDSSILGIDNVVELILAYVHMKEKEKR